MAINIADQPKPKWVVIVAHDYEPAVSYFIDETKADAFYQEQAERYNDVGVVFARIEQMTD
jgi:hypothetical protein